MRRILSITNVMFQNQSYKQKLSYTQNDNTDNVVNINIVLSTNHEIDKNIIADISGVIAQMFIQDYTNTEEIVQRQKEEKAQQKRISDEAKELIKNEKLEAKRKADEAKEIINMQKENDKRVANEKKEFDKRVKEETVKLKAKEEENKKPNKIKHWTRKKR
jgi:hypothetical protein